MLRATLATGVVFLLGLVVLQPDSFIRRLQSVGILLVLGLALHLVNRCGRTALASWGLVLGLTLLIAARSYTSGGMAAPVTPGFVVMAMLANLLLGLRGGIVVSALCVAVGVGFVVADARGVLPPSELVYSPGALWFYLAMWLGIALVLQWQITKTITDALSRTQAELAERQQAERRLQIALDAGRIAVWNIEAGTRRISGDRRLFALFGLPWNDGGLIDSPVWQWLIHPADQEKVQEAEQTLTAGEAGKTVRIDFRIVRGDGTIRHVEAFAVAMGAVSHGQPRIVGMNLDVTERRAAEDERLRLLFDLGERVKELRLLHDAARLLQRDHRPVAELFQEFVEMVPRAWMFPDDCEARLTHGAVQVSTRGWCETPWTLVEIFATADGPGRLEVAYRSPHPEVIDGPFLKEERLLLGSLAEMLGAHLDLRKHEQELEQLVASRTQELQNSYDRLRELEKLRDDLVHMVVHDMRSPLSVVMGRLSLVQFVHKDSLNADAARQLDSAKTAVDVLVRMTNDLLDVSRMEEQKLPLNSKPVDLGRLAQEVVEAMAGMDSSRQLVTETSGDGTVSCDAELIRRVIENLVSNGIKHTPAGTSVQIGVTSGAQGARVTVRDFGSGISPEARSRLFRKFGTVANRSASGHHSVGLGLAFCKLAVEAHGGTIGVETAAPGTIFWFELPTQPPS